MGVSELAGESTTAAAAMDCEMARWSVYKVQEMSVGKK
jgi:hypothetical protein